MASNNYDVIFKQVLSQISPTQDELKQLDEILANFIKKLNNEIKKSNTEAELFVGGSFAKGTLIKKQKYDIDLFIRFPYKYKDKNKELSDILEKILLNTQSPFARIHGSRDYFKVKMNERLEIELIPVLKISKPEKSLNITDLSYFHVRYINKKINQELKDQIKLAKAFTHAHNCYGAESYINGLSGYALELLIINYKTLLNLIKQFSKPIKNQQEKIIIDIEKQYKNKKTILLDINASKLESPIILVDPTYKQRNTLAALSQETFQKFQKACQEFLKNPSLELFEKQKTNLEKIKQEAKKNKQEFIHLETSTFKQEGDIAGSKLLKFYKFLENEISKYFIIKNKGFNYNDKHEARYFFTASSKKQILIKGPSIKQKEHLLAFEKSHTNYQIKKGRVLAKENIDFSLKEFIQDWKKKNKKLIKDMTITNIKIIDF